MGWHLERSAGGYIYEQPPLSLTDLQSRDEETAWMDLNRRPWKLVNGLIDQAGDPTALAGGFAGTEVTPPVGTLATVTVSSSSEAALWPVATWTPIAANPQCPKAYRLVAFGTQTTPASQGTLQLSARFGTVVGGPQIGLSTAAAQTASETATPWRIHGDVVIQRGGPATSGQVVAFFDHTQGTATSGGSTELPVLEQRFGTTTGAVSVITDGSTAAGLWLGVIIATSTTSAFLVQSVVWSSWN